MNEKRDGHFLDELPLLELLLFGGAEGVEVAELVARYVDDRRHLANHRRPAGRRLVQSDPTQGHGLAEADFGVGHRRLFSFLTSTDQSHSINTHQSHWNKTSNQN